MDSPFKLLEAYGPGDKDIFFGRDAEIYALYHLLQQTRLALVYGASGAGKTSLIQAGLPRVFRPSDWLRISVRRRDDLNAALRTELGRLDNQGPVADPVEAVRRIFETRWLPPYLVFDQFEELFILGSHPERLEFFENLQALLAAPLPCRVILSMREEYIGHLYDYEPLVPGLFDKRFRVEPMQDEVVRDVIGQMCRLHAIGLEEGPVTAGLILDQVKEGKQAAHLPYLQIYLHYLFEEARKKTGAMVFTLEDIGVVGRLGNVLKRYIESQFLAAQEYLGPLDPPVDLCARLLDEFATDEGTRRSRRATDLAEALNIEENVVDQALRYFTQTAKLLRADEDDLQRYEPIHDVVARQIHELRSAQDKEFRSFLHQLRQARDRWREEGAPADRLLTERDLSRADIYRARLEGLLDFETEFRPFVDSSRRHQERRRRRNRLYTLAVSIVAVVAVAASLFAFTLNRQAQEARRQAEASQREAERNEREAVANLRLYMEQELRRYLQDARYFIDSRDLPYAGNALDSAQEIRRRFFPENEEFQRQIEKLGRELRE